MDKKHLISSLCRYQLILFLIVLIAFLFRISYLNIAPAGFTWDEAALGYNAYSILKTGQDEYGLKFPLIFKSFGDYKPGLYVYSAIPFIATFGLTETATRLPSILMGSLIPLLAYLITRKLFPHLGRGLGLICALLLALSPWAITFSRAAWETNMAFFEFMLGFYFLLLSRERRWLLIFGLVLFSLSIFTYQSAKIFALIFPLAFCLIYMKEFFTKRTKIYIGISFLILGFALILSLANPVVRSRLEVLNQYGYKRSDAEISQIKKEEKLQTSQLAFETFHSEQLEYIKTASSRYLNYFSPKLLFIQGPPDSRQGVLNYGLVHLIELPFFFLGVFFFLKKHLNLGSSLLLWAAVAPIPAALSRDIVSTVRSLPLVFPLEFFAALGFYYFFYQIKSRSFKLSLVLLVIVLGGFNFGWFWDRYLIHSQIAGSEDWVYGYKQASLFVGQNQKKYDQIIFTTGWNEPYIFYLFYNQYDPSRFQKQSNLSLVRGVDVGEVEKIDNLNFRPLYWPDDRSLPRTLFIGKELELPPQDIDPKQSKFIKDINFLNGNVAFRIVETL